LPELPSEAPSSDGGLSQLIGSWMKSMMEELSPGDREVLNLSDLQGMSDRNIAARLGLSLSGAKSRVQRARTRLRGILLKCCRIELDRRGNPVRIEPRACRCSSCD
jgi:RNA polymerase sigma-70 factor (ECF subfamily)